MYSSDFTSFFATSNTYKMQHDYRIVIFEGSDIKGDTPLKSHLIFADGQDRLIDRYLISVCTSNGSLPSVYVAVTLQMTTTTKR